MRKSVLPAVLLFLLTLPAVSGAGVVAYNNLGPGDSYINWGTWFGTTPGGPTYVAAAQFTSAASGNLSGLTLGMFHNIGNNNVTLSLRSDAGGQLGSTLWSGSYSACLETYGDVFRLASLGGPMLTAGSTYWLQASTDSSSMQIWESNNQGIQGLMGRQDCGQWNIWTGTSYAMRVEVDGPAAVPEPGTMMLLGSGLVGLAAFARKRVRR
jgi:hypothetical protein